jgi:hypothetical protein
VEVIPPSEVASLLHKKLKRVYAHAAELGAAPIGGSWIFTQEALENALQRSREMAGGCQAPGEKRFIKTRTSNIFHETSHYGFGDAIPPRSGPVAGSKATQTHCGYFHCQFP